jgi:hypothetical protein
VRSSAAGGAIATAEMEELTLPLPVFFANRHQYLSHWNEKLSTCNATFMHFCASGQPTA